jgi:hypothetical protein
MYGSSNSKSSYSDADQDIIKLAYALYIEFIEQHWKDSNYTSNKMSYYSWTKMVTIDGNAGGYWVAKAKSIIEQLNDLPA